MHDVLKRFRLLFFPLLQYITLSNDSLKSILVRITQACVCVVCSYLIKDILCIDLECSLTHTQRPTALLSGQGQYQLLTEVVCLSAHLESLCQTSYSHASSYNYFHCKNE